MQQLFYYKMQQPFCYKMRQKFIKTRVRLFLQNATVITKCNDFIINCNVYYKMHRDMYGVLISRKINQLCAKLNINFTTF